MDVSGATLLDGELSVDSNGATVGGNALTVNASGTSVTGDALVTSGGNSLSVDSTDIVLDVGGTNVLTVDATNGVQVDGGAILNGGAAINGGATITSASTTQTLTVDDTEAKLASGTNSVAVNGTGTAVSGNATVSGTLGVTGLTSLNGGAAVTGDTSVSGNLSVTGSTDLTGDLDVTSGTNGLTVNATTGTTITAAGGNTLTVDGSDVSMASGTNSLTIDATTGTTIEGDLIVNGTITGFSPSTSSGITNGDSSIQVGGVNNEVVIIADDNDIEADGRGKIVVAKDQINIGVINSSGINHGLVVTEFEAVLTGGSTSTSLTLNDSGAHFENTDTGGPARVTGVADGVNKYDAVNVGQLRSAYAGVASAAALAAIPEALPGKHHSLVGHAVNSATHSLPYSPRQ